MYILTFTREIAPSLIVTVVTRYTSNDYNAEAVAGRPANVVVTSRPSSPPLVPEGSQQRFGRPSRRPDVLAPG